MKEKIELLRASVRPVVTFAIAGVISVITYKLVGKFGDADMAKMALVGMLTTGSAIFGFWFGNRKSQAEKS